MAAKEKSEYFHKGFRPSLNNAGLQAEHKAILRTIKMPSIGLPMPTLQPGSAAYWKSAVAKTGEAGIVVVTVSPGESFEKSGNWYFGLVGLDELMTTPSIELTCAERAEYTAPSAAEALEITAQFLGYSMIKDFGRFL